MLPDSQGGRDREGEERLKESQEDREGGIELPLPHTGTSNPPLKKKKKRRKKDRCQFSEAFLDIWCGSISLYVLITC